MVIKMRDQTGVMREIVFRVSLRAHKWQHERAWDYKQRLDSLAVDAVDTIEGKYEAGHIVERIKHDSSQTRCVITVTLVTAKPAVREFEQTQGEADAQLRREVIVLLARKRFYERVE
jgi:hypothetical protein